MGWNSSITASSAVGTEITFTPGITTEGTYVTGGFTAPKKGVYKFKLYGSGGSIGNKSGQISSDRYILAGNGGVGGYTEGYLLLEKDETVYIGAGGTCCAAFVSKTNGASLSAISKANLYFVAGGGGAGGAIGDNKNDTGWNCRYSDGGNGGGLSGADGGCTLFEDDYYAATGGTQSSGGTAGATGGSNNSTSGTYGVGGSGGSASTNGYYYAVSGRGGDGYYGGGAGGYKVSYDASSANNCYARAQGGAGGSGYVYQSTLTVSNNQYTSTTQQDAGAANNTSGYVSVTYYAMTHLPVYFEGVQLERLFFNGTEITSLVKDGTTIY